jgi:hypothetical protein
VGLPDVGRPTARRGPLGNILPRQVLGRGPKIVTSGACRRRWGQLPRLGAGRAPDQDAVPTGARDVTERVPTGLEGLDDILHGLLRRQHGPGCGCFGRRRDGRGLTVPGRRRAAGGTGPDGMIRDSATIGIDQPDCEDAGSTRKRWLLVNAKLKPVRLSRDHAFANDLNGIWRDWSEKDNGTKTSSPSRVADSNRGPHWMMGEPLAFRLTLTMPPERQRRQRPGFPRRSPP